MRKLAVLTGDIVNSMDLGERLSDVQCMLKGIPEEFNSFYPDSILEDVSIHRGDGWQMVVKKRQYALRVAIYVKSRLKAQFKIETRVSIGIGEVDRLDEDNISASTGSAFQLSGTGLDKLDRDRYLASSNQAAVYEILFLDCILKKHTPEQASAVRLALLGLTQTAIGNAENQNSSTSSKSKSQQAVAGLLERAFWWDILKYLNYFESKKQH